MLFAVSNYRSLLLFWSYSIVGVTSPIILLLHLKSSPTLSHHETQKLMKQYLFTHVYTWSYTNQFIMVSLCSIFPHIQRSVYTDLCSFMWRHIYVRAILRKQPNSYKMMASLTSKFEVTTRSVINTSCCTL